MGRIDGNSPRITTTQTPEPAKAEGTTTAAAPPKTEAASAPWTGKPAAAPPPVSAVKVSGSGAQKDIVCPVLGALVAEGKVKMAPDGTVNIKDLNKALGDVGLSKPYQVAIHPVGWGANSLVDLAHNVMGDKMNVEELRSGMIKHPGDSAILTAGSFDQAKFNKLTSFAENGVMTEASFGKAIAANVLRDAHPGQILDTMARGKTFSEVEFGALLGAFGKKDPHTGKLGIPVEDMRALYQDKQLPPGRSGAGTIINAAALTASLGLKVDAQLASHALGSLATATGLAHHGANLAAGKPNEDAAKQQAAMSAGKAASCPYLSGAVKMPKAPAEAINAHTPAGMTNE